MLVWPRGKRRTKTSGPLGIDWGGETRRVGTPVTASQIGDLLSVRASTRYEDGFGGHDLATCTFAPGRGYIGGMFRPGDPFRIQRGGGTVFDGEFSEALPGDDGTVEIHARGHAYDLYGYDSIHWQQVEGADDIFYPTTQLTGGSSSTKYGWDYAVDTLALPINQVVGTRHDWSSPYGATDMAEGPIKLGDVITAKQREHNERWAVWGRTLVLGPDPTEPRWKHGAPSGLVGVADTDYATHVLVWYVSGGPATWSAGTTYAAGVTVAYGSTWWRALTSSTGVTPAEGSTWEEVPVAYRKSDFSMVLVSKTTDGVNTFDVRTAVVDYRGLGKMSSARASGLATSLLEQVKGRFVVSGSFTIAPDSGFKSINGGRAPVSSVRAGDMVRLTGMRTSQGSLLPGGQDQIIGKTEWSWSRDGSESNTITLMGSVPRSLSEILRGQPLDASVVATGKGSRSW